VAFQGPEDEEDSASWVKGIRKYFRQGDYFVTGGTLEEASNKNKEEKQKALDP
jgi:amino acid transporter